MNPLREFAPQTALAAMQAAAIIGGTLAVSAMLKTHEISGAALPSRSGILATAALLREWGFLLLVALLIFFAFVAVAATLGSHDNLLIMSE